MTSKPVAIVTGGAGFIGSHMVDLLLERGFAVRVIDNLTGGHAANLRHHADSSDLSVDERDIRALEPEDGIFSGARYVFHFAGIGDIVPSIERPLDYMDVNVQGTARVLEGARAAGVQKFVLWPCRGADHRSSSDYAAIPLCLEQEPGRTGGVSLASGLWPASQLGAYF
jgi:UDP-glucose 4-epimerase